MSATPLFDQPEPRIADTSRLAFNRVLHTLAERERQVLLALYRYLSRTGYDDATGGELALEMGVPTTTVRPRLTGLSEPPHALVDKGPARKSRAPGEGRCHGYRPTLPREAFERTTGRPTTA